MAAGTDSPQLASLLAFEFRLLTPRTVHDVRVAGCRCATRRRAFGGWEIS
jgi:hypothetical protein